MRDGVGGPSSVGIGGEALEQRGDNGGEGDVVLSGPEPCFVVGFIGNGKGKIAFAHESSYGGIDSTSSLRHEGKIICKVALDFYRLDCGVWREFGWGGD